jgi:adenosylcobinamide-GDP ribazoletransferase
MVKQWKIFLTAVMYFTRIRVPQYIGHDPGYLNKAAAYFPLVGWIVGGISALVFLVFARLVSSDIGIIASMIAGLLVTGAFHEDGFADVCDGFGGGWTKEKILIIMKDSRVGAFGAIGLIVILGSKFLLLRELPSFTPELNKPAHLIFYNYRYFIGAVIAAHGLSRLMPIIAVQWMANVTDPEHSKSRPVTSRKLDLKELLTAVLFGVAPLAFFPWPFWLVVLPAGYVTWEMAKYFRKWIGGYTGDCLGAIQQVTEIVIYLGWTIIWRYIL